MVEQALKNLTISLNETDFKLFNHQAEKRNLTPYALHKRIVTEYLKEGHKKDMVVLRDRKGILVSYILFVYSVITTAILVF